LHQKLNRKQQIKFINHLKTKVMKHLFLILFAGLLLIGCKKPVESIAEIEKLPPATHTGANKAGCLVNGIAFLPKGYSPDGSNLHVYYDGDTFGMAIDNGTNNLLKTVFVSSSNTPLHNNINIPFVLEEYGNSSKFGEYIIYNSGNNNTFRTTNTITGELKITYYNHDQRIISGTFWFDAVNVAGETAEIREGRFDMRY
jgi:hypothetical protein